MSLFTDENILDLLYSYNPWWKTGSVQKEFDKPMKRIAFYEGYKALCNDSVRRAVLLSGARRTGKTTILYQTVSQLLHSDVLPKNVLFISFDHPLLKMCTISDILNVYEQNVSLMRFSIRRTGTHG